MVSFFISFYRLLKILVTGIKHDKDFRFLFLFILILLFSATLFYSKMEGWTIIDALYFSIMTMSTVGYGDLVPTTDISKVFTIIYTFLSIGSFVSFTAKTVTIVSDNYKKKREKINKLRLKNEDE